MRKQFPETEFTQVMNELREVGASDDLLEAFREVHKRLIAAGDLLLGVVEWPGGKEHFMADGAFDELESSAVDLRTKAQEVMLKPHRKRPA
jgi:hypothetical protein